jgi:predicted DCC family thiol-disulfide oxidoreductase YuxK
MGSILFWDRERQIRPLALQEAAAADLLPGVDEEERLASFHLVEADGTVRSGGDALPFLLRSLPQGGPAGWLVGKLQPLTDLGYHVVSHNRDKVGPFVPDRWKRWAERQIAARQAEIPGDTVEQAARDLSGAGVQPTVPPRARDRGRT